VVNVFKQTTLEQINSKLKKSYSMTHVRKLNTE